MLTLVTGAAGFVGSHLTRLLIERGKTVRVLIRSPTPLASIEKLPCECVYADLRDAPSVQKALKGVDHVFHVAADYRLWAKNPNEIYENNVTGTRNLVHAARLAGVDRFIYTSTVGTIAVPRGAQLPNEHTRATIGEMIGHYKKSKLLAEDEVLQAAAAGFPAVIVNPTTPLGPGDWKPTPTGVVGFT